MSLILKHYLKEQMYLKFLHNQLPLLLEDSLGDVTHEEVPPRFSSWVPAFRHGTYPSHWNVRSRSHALSQKSPHLKPPDIITKYKQNRVKHNSMILLRCILTLLQHVSAVVMSHLLDLLDEVYTPYSKEKHSIQKRLNTVILY